MKIKLPQKFALIPILDFDRVIGDIVVKNIRVIGYAVSKCYLVEETTTFNDDGSTNKQYKVQFPFGEVFLTKDIDMASNNIQREEPTESYVDQIYEDYSSARRECDNINSIIFGKELGKKKEKKKNDFEVKFERKVDYIERNSARKLSLERKKI